MLFVHCGVLSVGVRRKLGLSSRFELRYGQPLDVQRFAVDYPSLPIIVPHFGAGFFREALMLAEACPNVVLDTSSTNGWVRYHPGLTLTDVFRTAMAVVGPDRLMFGTDSSFFPRGWQAPIYDTQRAILEQLGTEDGFRAVDLRRHVQPAVPVSVGSRSPQDRLRPPLERASAVRRAGRAAAPTRAAPQRLLDAGELHVEHEGRVRRDDGRRAVAPVGEVRAGSRASASRRPSSRLMP